jgi:hypothetical protein
VLAQLLLARRFAAIPCWRPWRRYLLASGIATAVALAVFLPNTTSPTAGLLQRIAVTIPLAAMTAVAARLGRLDTGLSSCIHRPRLAASTMAVSALPAVSTWRRRGALCRGRR